MDKIKPWQLILIVLAIAVLGFSVWKYGGGKSPESQLANSMMLVDVQTGQRFIADISGKKSVLLPARNPDTQEVSLIPVYEEDGSWFLWERYRTAISQITVSPDAVPDVNGPVRVTDATPIRLK